MAVAKYRKKAVPWDEAYWNVPWVPVRWTKDQALLRTDLDPECPPKGIRTDHVKKLLAWKTRPDFDPTDKSQWWRAMVGNTSRRQAKQEAEWFRSLG
jgi:hypothetical protein